MGSGVGVGLEGAENPLVAHGLDGGQQGVELAGVVGVVVVDVGPVVHALFLHAAACTVERGQATGRRFTVDAAVPRHGNSCQGIEGVVTAHHAQFKMAVGGAIAENVESVPVVAAIYRPDGAVLTQTEGDVVDARQGFLGVGIVAGGDDTARFRHQLGKGTEGFLNVGQILEEIQMVGFHVENHGHGGEKVQERVIILAAFHDNRAAAAHPVPGVQQGKTAADHDGGVLLGFHKDVGYHGGSGGFAVGTGDADGFPVGLHDVAPGLGPLKNGNAQSAGGGDFRVVVVDGGGADDGFRALNVFGPVADGHGDALSQQAVGGGGVAHIGTGDG